MKGLEIRATGFAAKIVKALGGVPVGAPMPDVYEMLAKGIVVGTWSSLDTLMSYRHTEVTKYVTLNGLYVSSFYIVMNSDTWNKIPKDLQHTLESYTQEFLKVAADTWDERSNKAEQYAKEQGLEIIQLSDAELARWKKTTAPLVEEFVKDTESKGLNGKQFLTEMERLKEQYRK